jgi:energy-coupling factor transport system permease protein
MHTLTWLLWLCAALAAVTLAPSPLYTLLLFLVAALVFAAWGASGTATTAAPAEKPAMYVGPSSAVPYGAFIRLGALVFLGYLLFSIITVGGARGATVLLRLPQLRLPALLGGIALGGPITAEALAWGATRGMQIWALLAIFGAFNTLVSHYRLLRLAPRALFHAGLAVTIAVGFVPHTLRAIATIIEAQRVRGHRFRGPRSALPLLAPLLAGSLEKSVQLAEALDARGYGRTRPGDLALSRQQAAALAGLLLLGAGVFTWLYYGARYGLPAAGLCMAGALLLLAALRALGRLVPRTSYRRERWRPRDSAVAVAAALCVAALIAMRLSNPLALVYYPFPRISRPPFDPRAGVALLLLAAPALFAGSRSSRRAPQAPRRGTLMAQIEQMPADRTKLEQP